MVSTAARVPSQTAAAINRRIRQETEERLAYYEKHSGEIDERLAKLDREWDIERAIEANAALFALTGVVLGAAVGRRWLVLPGLVTTFLLQHAVQGWCPPIPVLRRMGYRTADEIGKERYALKALRGDFSQVARAKNKRAALVKAVGLNKANGQA